MASVVCIGDSITAGQYQDVAWPSLLTEAGHELYASVVQEAL